MASNLSDWVDSNQASVMTLKRGDKTVDWADLSQDGDKSVCFRLELQCTDEKQMMMYLTRIPISHEELVELGEKWECEINSEKIPVNTCLMGQQGIGNKVTLMAHLMVQEKPGHKSGFGIYPLIEQVSFQYFMINVWKTRPN